MGSVEGEHGCLGGCGAQARASAPASEAREQARASAPASEAVRVKGVSISSPLEALACTFQHRRAPRNGITARSQHIT
jgi:hypothetical protein